MKVHQPETRLRSLWGRIDAQHNELIRQRIRGRRVLDLGCGYGALTDHLARAGFEVEGWDNDPASLEQARRLFPGAPILGHDLLEAVAGREKSFDTIVMKDSFHHIVGEGDPVLAFAAVRALLADSGRLVVLDPNLTPFLRLARWLIRHQDEEAPIALARSLLREEW